MTKPISFKQAGLIVIALHVAGFVGFTQYASYKARVARELREEKRAEMLAGNRLKQDWNNDNIKPRIVATVVPKRADEIKSPASSQINQILQKVETVAQTATDSLKETATEVTAIATTSMQALNDKPREIVKKVPSLQVKQPTKKPVVVPNQKATREAFLATKRQEVKPSIHSSPKIDIDALKENVQVIKREVRRMTSQGIERESYSVQRMPVASSGHTQVFVMGSDLLEAY